jgi:hypothetical protein
MEEQNKVKKSTPAVETFTDDMVKVIEDDKGGLIKKIIKEQEAHEVERKNLSPQSRKNRTFILVGLILILFAVALLAFLFFKQNNQTIPLVINTTTQSHSLIFTDTTIPLNIAGLDRDTIAQNITSEVQHSTIKESGIEAITPFENGKPIGLRRFVEIIKSSFDPSNLDLVSDNFLMGVVGGQPQRTPGAPTIPTSGNSFFILIKMRSFVDIFPLLNHWESKMFSELHGFFGLDSIPATSDLMTKSFTGGIIENKNARILYDDNGNIALMYVFADDQSVIIANNTDAVNQVILRLAGNQIK